MDRGGSRWIAVDRARSGRHSPLAPPVPESTPTDIERRSPVTDGCRNNGERHAQRGIEPSIESPESFRRTAGRQDIRTPAHAGDAAEREHARNEPTTRLANTAGTYGCVCCQAARHEECRCDRVARPPRRHLVRTDHRVSEFGPALKGKGRSKAPTHMETSDPCQGSGRQVTRRTTHGTTLSLHPISHLIVNRSCG